MYRTTLTVLTRHAKILVLSGAFGALIHLNTFVEQFFGDPAGAALRIYE
jgi:hypothetical protein